MGRSRLATLPASLLGVTLITFVLLRVAPGDPATVQTGVASSALEQEALRQWQHLQGHDAPLLVSYLRWLGGVLTLDFGRSLIDQRPVTTLLAEAAPSTILLNGLALLAIYGCAVALGLWSAAHRGTRREAWLGYGMFALYAVPAFSAALVALSTLGLWGVFPLRGLHSPGLEGASVLVRALDSIWHLVLPVLCLAYVPMVRIARVQRASALEVRSQDWVTVARAKGVDRTLLWRRHIWPAAVTPIVTLLSLDLPAVLGGSVIVERIFTIRGMGMLLFDAILRRDYPVILGVVTVVAMVTVLALALGDAVGRRLDPRRSAP